MKVLANKVWQRILAMLLVIVSVFSLTNLPSFARRTVTAATQTATLTINRDSFGTASGYAWHAWTATTTTEVSISGSGYIYGDSKSSIQVNGSKVGDYIYNTTALPGKIVSVTLVGASGKTARNFDVLTSDAAFNSATTASLKGEATDAKKTVTESGATWTFEPNHQYFAIVICDTKAAYLSSIAITYEYDNDNSCEHTYVDGVCSKCGQSCTHSYGEWEIITAATCTAVGSQKRTCSACGTVETEEIPMADHNYADGVCTVCNAKQPTTLTITKANFTGSTYAWNLWTATTTTGESVSGYGYTYGANANIQVNGSKDGDYIYNTTALPERIISVTITKASGTDRNFDVLTSATPFDSATTASLKGQATEAKKLVTMDGVTWELKTNHKYFAIVICDSSAAYLSSIEIKYGACAHAENVAIGEAKDATCTEDGITAGVKCADCGEIITAQEPIPATGHNYVGGVCAGCGEAEPTHTCSFEGEGTVTLAPTCTTTGVRTWTCTHDGCEETKTEEISALGHSYGEWVETTAATCTAAGEETKICSRCSDTQTQPIEALGHSHGEWTETTAATCTTVGEKTQTCSLCGDVLTEEIPATGHSYVKGVCTVCGNEGIGFTKVTSDLTDWSGKYLIVYEEGNVAFNGALDTLDAESNTQSVSIIGNQIAAGKGTSLATAYFTIAKVDDGYSIQSSSGAYIGRTTDSNGFNEGDTVYVNTLNINADGSVNIIGSGGAYLRYNKTSGQERFRYYKSGSYTNQQPIALYKMDADMELPMKIQELSTTADFSIVYADGKTEDGNYVINKASICFGLTISDALYQECAALDNVVLGIEVCKKDEISDPLKWKDYNSVDSWDAATLEDGSYTFGVIIGLGSGANWDKEIVAKAYIKIGDTKYYLSEVSYSINSLATEYLTKDEYKNDEIYSSVLTILQGDNGKTGGVQA